MNPPSLHWTCLADSLVVALRVLCAVWLGAGACISISEALRPRCEGLAEERDLGHDRVRVL